MTSRSLESVANSLVTDGKRILAADETVPTITKRFDTLGIESTEQSRCTYREMLFSSPGAPEFIAGAIMANTPTRWRRPPRQAKMIHHTAATGTTTDWCSDKALGGT